MWTKKGYYWFWPIPIWSSPRCRCPILGTCRTGRIAASIRDSRRHRGWKLSGLCRKNQWIFHDFSYQPIRYLVVFRKIHEIWFLKFILIEDDWSFFLTGMSAVEYQPISFIILQYSIILLCPGHWKAQSPGWVCRNHPNSFWIATRAMINSFWDRGTKPVPSPSMSDIWRAKEQPNPDSTPTRWSTWLTLLAGKRQFHVQHPHPIISHRPYASLCIPMQVPLWTRLENSWDMIQLPTGRVEWCNVTLTSKGWTVGFARSKSKASCTEIWWKMMKYQ